jgi:hypothetical protein
MPVYVGSTVVFPTVFPAPDTVNAPGSPFLAYNNDQGSQYAYWSYPGAASGPGLINTGSFQYRTIFTHGFMAAGYKGFNPWRSVNRTWHATDVTTYCGEQLDRAGAYVDGTFSDFNAYVHTTVDAFQGASNWTSAYSLTNGTRRMRGAEGTNTTTGVTATSAENEIGPSNSPTSTTSSGSGTGGDNVASGMSDFNLGGFPNPTSAGGDGGWALTAAKSVTAACISGQTIQQGFITGGGSTNTDRFHFPSEIMYTGNAAPYAGGQCPSAQGQNYGWVSFGGSHAAISFSSQTWTVQSSGFWDATIAPDGGSKILSSKNGFHFGGSGANVTTGFAKFSDVNGTSINSALSKPYALGEENFEMGQDWGYCLGQYDGQQNNMTFKVNYSTSTCTVMGYATMPKGHVGQSSAACSSAAMSICGSMSAGGF